MKKYQNWRIIFLLLEKISSARIRNLNHNTGKKIVYADWTASGRIYLPIEEKLINEIGPFTANTHTETSITGSVMTHTYHIARKIIKEHVNASEDNILITTGRPVPSINFSVY